jgi:hypothetical protein
MLLGAALAQSGTIKIGILVALEGAFATGGQDGVRNVELALKQVNNTLAARMRSTSSINISRPVKIAAFGGTDCDKTVTPVRFPAVVCKAGFAFHPRPDMVIWATGVVARGRYADGALFF